ncbi:hypothetical protein VPH35_112023 [Triticum aestivum]
MREGDLQQRRRQRQTTPLPLHPIFSMYHALSHRLVRSSMREGDLQQRRRQRQTTPLPLHPIFSLYHALSHRGTPSLSSLMAPPPSLLLHRCHASRDCRRGQHKSKSS